MTTTIAKKLSCGGLRIAHEGQSVELNGWVNRRRDHGGLVFIDLRDRDGITQVVFDPAVSANFDDAHTLRSEDVIKVTGLVRRRPAGTANSKLPTGEVELAAHALAFHSRAQTPPFPISSDEDVDEALRLKYRYLDLRRPRMQHNLTVRHRIIKAMRDYFDEAGFLEIETPLLIKSTPEGARDFLVPSRIYPGTFYALPQSPQILKQILMISGFGRYMQIARCFRDEDSRSDRQWEFTQLDVELSFATQDDVLDVMEGCIVSVWQKALGITMPRPFPRFTFDEVMQRYGSDKPDLRFDLELAEITDRFKTAEFKVFRAVAEAPDGAIYAVRYPGGATLSRREFDALTETAKGFGASGMVWIALAEDGNKSSISKFLDEAMIADIAAAAKAEKGDAIVIVADKRRAAQEVAGKLRLEIGERGKLRDPKRFAFGWVLNFPMFERDPETGAPVSTHHPFTAPYPGQEAMFESDPFAVRAQHYDMILNGWELGSGSIRIHNPELQKRVFRSLGHTEEEIAERFGFFIAALDYGVPPHGGMALGLDRIAMIACGETSIRDVIAFPKNQGARDLMMDAPSSVPPESLRELGLEIKAKKPASAPASP